MRLRRRSPKRRRATSVATSRPSARMAVHGISTDNAAHPATAQCNTGGRRRRDVSIISALTRRREATGAISTNQRQRQRRAGHGRILARIRISKASAPQSNPV